MTFSTFIITSSVFTFILALEEHFPHRPNLTILKLTAGGIGIWHFLNIMQKAIIAFL